MDTPLYVVLISLGMLLSAAMAVAIVRGGTARSAVRSAGRMPSGAESDFDRLFEQVGRQIRAYSSLPAYQRAEQSGQIAAMLARMSARLSDSNRLASERYERRASELSGLAAEAGIDWRAPSC